MSAGSDWSIGGKRTDSAELALKATLRQSTAGGSGAFLGLASDGARYWIKPLNNPQGDRVPVTEQIVGRIGALMHAPTCTVRTISVDGSFTGWEFRPGHRVAAGIAHASLHVGDVVETRALDRHMDDDNSRRYAFLMALYDLCWGGDVQGLLSLREDNRFYSHDHGWYLPLEGPRWEIASLEADIGTPHELQIAGGQISRTIAGDVAAAVDGLTKSKICGALARIPRSWPVSDEELETVGRFLERRAPEVARRIERRLGGRP